MPCVKSPSNSLSFFFSNLFDSVQFQDILKPAYNIIDMLEVELLDDDSEPRAFSEQLLQVKLCADALYVECTNSI